MTLYKWLNSSAVTCFPKVNVNRLGKSVSLVSSIPKILSSLSLPFFSFFHVIEAISLLLKTSFLKVFWGFSLQLRSLTFLEGHSFSVEPYAVILDNSSPYYHPMSGVTHWKPYCSPSPADLTMTNTIKGNLKWTQYTVLQG